jgi:hypothetical protein
MENKSRKIEVGFRARLFLMSVGMLITCLWLEAGNLHLVLAQGGVPSPAASPQSGRLEVVPEAAENPTKLIRGQSLAIPLRVRNAGEADLTIKKLDFGYAADSKDKPVPEWKRPDVVGLDGIILPKGVSTNITVIFPAYPNAAEYKGQLYMTRQGPTDNPEIFYVFKLKIEEPSAKTWNSRVAGLVAALLAAVMLILTVFLRGKDKLNFFQSPDKSYSVSRFQVWFWTEVVLFSYAYLFFFKGSNVPFPDSIWGLLGISIGSTGIATGLAIKNDAAATATAAAAAVVPPVPPPPPPPVAAPPPAPAVTPPRLGPMLSMLSDEGRPSMMRLQLFAWTIATGVFFLRQVYASETLWDVPTNLLILMGISHGGYLVDKGVKST